MKDTVIFVALVIAFSSIPACCAIERWQEGKTERAYIERGFIKEYGSFGSKWVKP